MFLFFNCCAGRTKKKTSAIDKVRQAKTNQGANDDAFILAEDEIYNETNSDWSAGSSLENSFVSLNDSQVSLEDSLSYLENNEDSALLNRGLDVRSYGL